MIAHRYSLPSAVRCSVMSASHNRFGAGGGEVAADQVVVDRRTGLLAVAAAFLAERAPPAHGRADPPRGPIRHRQARRRGPRRPGTGSRTPDRRGARRTTRSPDTPRSSSVVGDRPGTPPVVRLSSDVRVPGTSPRRESRRRPARSRAGRAFSRQVRLRQIRRARRRTSFSCSSSLIRLRASRSSADSVRLTPGLAAVVDLGLAQPLEQRHRVDPEVVGDLLDRHAGLAVTGDPHDIVAELPGVGLGHSDILPAHHHGKPSQMSPIGAADP